MSKITSLFTIFVLVGFGFYFQKDIINIYDSLFYNPCSKPISYSIGRLDNDFNLSEEEFIQVIKEAEDIWEKGTGKNLFEYSKDGEMKINLIYDDRQEGTDELDKIDSNYQADKKTYEELKSKYDQYISEYNILTTERDKLLTDYNQQVSAYEAEVKRWNNKKNISEDVYNRLNNKRDDLNSFADTIKNLENKINDVVPKINDVATTLNYLSKKLNIDANTYNLINQSFEDEFEQGVYISSLKSKEINVYQFDNREKLVRVLAHELGHSLGIGHLDNSEDIMYSLNINENKDITKDDIAELDNICSKSFIDKILNR
jgi:regulator of replication initiation timing